MVIKLCEHLSAAITRHKYCRL